MKRKCLYFLLLFLFIGNSAVLAIPPSPGLPSQFGHTGKFLQTNGSLASWVALAGGGDFLADGTVPMTGDLVMGTHSITGIGSIGATGSRVTKVWSTDLELTNAPTVGGNPFNAATATALAADPANCAAGEVALGVTAAGVAECSAAPVVSAANMTSFPTLNQNTSGNAATATALAADPANCAAGQIAVGVNDSGVAECTATPSGLTSVGATSFTGSSILVTGIADGLTNVVKATSTPVTVGGAGLLSAFYLGQHATPATAMVYDLPVASAGQQFCFKNSHGAGGANTGTIRVHPVTNSYMNVAGTNCTISYDVLSSANAAGDYLCVLGVDATHWEVFGTKGTFACAAPL